MRRSKAAGEAELRAAFPAAIVLRPSIVFGPEDDFFNRFAAYATPPAGLAAHRRRRHAVPAGLCRRRGEGGGRRARARGTDGKIFELAGPKIYTLRELMELLLREIGRQRGLIQRAVRRSPRFKAWFLEFLPKPPLTRDQVRMLQRDNVATPAACRACAELGITPTALELILPTYLDRFRRGGRGWRARPRLIRTARRGLQKFLLLRGRGAAQGARCDGESGRSAR